MYSIVKTGKMVWTPQWSKHEWFISKDIWRIFDSKDLEDFSFHNSRIFCLTGAITVKRRMTRLNNIATNCFSTVLKIKWNYWLLLGFNFIVFLFYLLKQREKIRWWTFYFVSRIEMSHFCILHDLYFGMLAIISWRMFDLPIFRLNSYKSVLEQLYYGNS